MMMCLSLHCACAQERKAEQVQLQDQRMRLMAVTLHQRKRLFDPEREEAAWRFAGKRGAVLKWSKVYGGYFPLPRPGSNDPVAEIVEAIG